MKKLLVEGRYLKWDDGTPFFYLGETAWELFHRLSRPEMDYYLSQRARQGFNVIQAVALAENEGLTVPDPNGRLPLFFTDGMPDPTRPDDEGEMSYWKSVDYGVHSAAEKGMFIALLPTWGDKFNQLWGKGPMVFDEQNAYIYGKWIAKRYTGEWNIIWMLGGDRPLEPEHRKIIDAMAKGILEEDQNHLITFHPPGGRNSTEFVGDADYIDFHTAQTGHDVKKCYTSYVEMSDMEKATHKPYMDSEPRYEDHPACFKPSYKYLWKAEDIRQNAYWNLLAGACGYTYGNHNTQCMNRKHSEYFPYLWNEALLHEGVEQISYVRSLRERGDYFSFRSAPGLAEGGGPGMGHIISARGEGYAYVYSPLGLPFVVHMPQLDAKVWKSLWMDPRTGKEETFAIVPGDIDMQFVPPTQGKGCDWVLILEKLG